MRLSGKHICVPCVYYWLAVELCSRNMLVSPEVPGYQVSASLPSAKESENDAGEVPGVAWLFFKYPSSNLSLLEILPACSQKSTRLMEIIKKTELAPRE